jgi:putative PEP-CTERM system TPR-repeat lipoprotein
MSDAKQPLWSRSVAAALAVSLGITLSACRGGDTATMMAEARQYRDQGDIKAAVIQLKNVIQNDAGNRSARVMLGQLYLDQGDPQSAEKELRRALALGADSGNVTLMLARALLMQGQYERLLTDIVPTAAPAQRPALLAMRGNALLGQNKVEPARALFAEALKLHADAPEALLGLARIALWQQQGDTARQLLKRALATNPDHVDLLRFQADLLRADGDNDAALAVQQTILRRHPQQAQALLDVANIHSDAARYPLARAALAQARKASGASLGVMYSQAMLSYRENKLPAALEAVQRILRVAPDHYPSVLLAGTVQSALGSPQQAELHLRKFLQAYPKHLYASKLLAAVNLALRQPEAALSGVRPLLAEHPDDPELMALAGEANLRTGNFAQAASYFERASERQPQAPGRHTGLALSRLANGETGRALEELERANSLERNGSRLGVLLVMTYLRANQPDKALEAVQHMEKQDNSALVHNLKGGIFMARQDFKAARASFDKALSLDAVYLPALANLQQLDAIENKTASTGARYLAALAKAPANTAVMEALSGLALAQRKPAEAIGWMERAAAVTPEALPLTLRMGELYLRTGAQDKALVLARKLHTSHPDSAEALALLAQAYVANANYGDAADTYARLAALTPGAALPQMRIGAVRIAQGRNADAAAALRKALALEPDLLEARITLVKLLLRMNKVSDALALAAAAQQRQPRNAAGYKLEGDVHSAQGRHADALKAYEKALALNPRGPLLVQVHGELLKLNRQAEAEARLNDWFKQHPADIPTRLHVASSKLVANDPKGAITHYQAVLKADPNNLAALNDLAWSYQRLGQRQALAFARRAHQLAPANPAIMDTLGYVLMEQGDLARALPLLQQASAMSPQAGEIQYHYAMLLARSGDKRAARRVLEKALASRAAFTGRAEANALLATL